MRDIISILERWTSDGTAIAVGSVIERIGSAPRDPGATLAVSGAGEVAGSVTGGCVEPAVIREATEVLNGSPGPHLPLRALRRRGLRRRAHLRRLDRRRRLRARSGARAAIADAVASDTSIAMTVRLSRGALRRAAARPRRPSRRRPSSTGRRCSLLELGESGIVETARRASSSSSSRTRRGPTCTSSARATT